MEGNIWLQNQYRIKKKVVALTNQYWIEDWNGRELGYSRQKLLRIKEDIRIFTDASMSAEVFRIQQENVMNDWGTFSVIDSPTGLVVGKIRRSFASNYVWDEYQLLDANGNQFGKVAERAGRGLARKFVPFGGLVPEHMCLEVNGKLVCEIKQQFKIVGDTWEVDLSSMPDYLDRRIILAAMLMMGMVEREKK
ncbi:MAG: hypothetical protein LUQ16_06615 [Methanomassiliicoccales archaeon]|nr:hypothetical protein [Methanomassiliicoccales archaeon]MDD1756219.1 hypothetical protein [Methanomassiliicoccales archaeon]